MPYNDIVDEINRRYIGPTRPQAPGLPVYAHYFNEREMIRLKREKGLPPPWTDDPIYRDFRFTNVLRKDDKVSRQLCEAMDTHASLELLLFNMFVFRTFNCLSGFQAMGGWTEKWGLRKARKNLDKAYANGVPLFGNAYLMTNSMTKGAPKHQFYLTVFDMLWRKRAPLIRRVIESLSLEKATGIFRELPGYGDFLAYEMALDCQMLKLLQPTDAHTWANPGPGARRGLNHVFGRPRKTRIPTDQALEEMRWLYQILPDCMEIHVPPLDMRCIENGLCETQKFYSVLETGRAKRRYKYD